MPLFAPSQAQKFTPKEIKFSQLYKTGTGGGKPGYSVMSRAKEALAKAGYDEKKISQMITGDAKISVSQMKEVASLMNKSGIYGFQKSPSYLVQQFLTKERVKAQNIARIRREHIAEASQEDLGSYGTTSLNPQGRSPNTVKASSENKRSPIRSLSGNSSSGAASSLSSRSGGSSSLGGKSTGSTFKPNF